jgi:hypothetical protein
MKIEQQVVSLDLAKQLKDAGYPQDDSVLYWCDSNHGYWELENLPLPANEKDWCAAPTVAELGEKLPDWVDFTQKHYNSNSRKTWFRCYCKEFNFWFDCDTEEIGRASCRERV